MPNVKRLRNCIMLRIEPSANANANANFATAQFFYKKCYNFVSFSWVNYFRIHGQWENLVASFYTISKEYLVFVLL